MSLDNPDVRTGLDYLFEINALNAEGVAKLGQLVKLIRGVEELTSGGFSALASLPPAPKSKTRAAPTTKPRTPRASKPSTPPIPFPGAKKAGTTAAPSGKRGRASALDSVSDEDLRRAFEAHRTVSGVAKQYGVAQPTAKKRLEQAGILGNGTGSSGGGGRRGKTRTEIDRDELRDLVEAGKSNKELAAHFGVSEPTINNRIKEYGLVGIRPRGRAASSGSSHSSRKGRVSDDDDGLVRHVPESPEEELEQLRAQEAEEHAQESEEIESEDDRDTPSFWSEEDFSQVEPSGNGDKPKRKSTKSM